MSAVSIFSFHFISTLSKKVNKHFSQNVEHQKLNEIHLLCISVVAAVNNAASSYNSYTSQLAPAVTAAANSGYSNNASVSDSGSSGMNISVLNNRAPANLITVHSQVRRLENTKPSKHKF